MNLKKSFIIFLFLLMISMGAVCAEDINQTQDTLDSTNSNLLMDNSAKTYTDLFDEINNASDSITLESNYKYNESDGKNTSFEFSDGSTFTIEGNNRIIDGSGKASLFYVSNQSSLIIKNLIITNCTDTAITVNNATLTTINVTFQDSHSQYGGALKIGIESTYTSVNDRFINNYANMGASIFTFSSTIDITNGLFANDRQVNWSMIYSIGSILNINETTFANTTSKYATAIYNSFKTTIRKSKFINLAANATAGAIAIKTTDNGNYIHYTAIYDSEFINVSARRNGGALFVDAISYSDNNTYNGITLISNTTFDGCSAEFGGAILELGGILEVLDSKFANNHVAERGGAIYTSNATVFIENNSFANNRAHPDNGFGGALYLDYGAFKIDKSEFTANVASQGGAIYSFSNEYTIADSTFTNNGEDIHTYFDDQPSSIKNCGEYVGKVNDDKFEIPIRYNGNEIILNPRTISGSANDSYFNLKDLGLVTPVRNQGSMGACWAFGAAGAFESAFLIATNISLDISENNIQNMELRYSVYGKVTNTESGTLDMAASYFASWLGAVNVIDDEYDELGKISSMIYNPDAYRVVDVLYINMTDRNAIKEALTTYGGLNIFIYGANSEDADYYNPQTYATYYYGNGSGNHYVTLVGWNDNYSATNFVKEAPGDGAWICKNSWGTNWGDEGYFYLSYYDKSLVVDATTYIFNNTIYYEKLYQNEMAGWNTYDDEYNTYSQVFESHDGDIIAAVGSYFIHAGIPYKVSILINDNTVYTQTGTVDHSGYNTIKLNKYIVIDKNSTFEVIITADSVPIVLYSRLPLYKNMNFMMNDKKRVDLSEEGLVAPIKVYTFKNPGISENIAKCYDGKKIVFTVTNVEGDQLVVTFKNTNHTINITDGEGSLSLGVLPIGNYILTVHYKGQKILNQVLVENSIDTDGATSATIVYNTQLTFTARLLDSNRNPLNKIAVTAIFDGKTLKGKTSADGMFSVTIEKGCKVGTHYLTFKNPKTGQSVKVTIKILSRLRENKNVNMYYNDGSAYKVRVVANNGKYEGKNKVVLIKIGKKSFKVKTNAKGYAILKIPYTIAPGKYAITATYAGQTVKNTLLVKHVLAAPKTVSIKKSAKRLILTATLKKGKTPLASKVVKFQLNGKIFAAKTNKYGIAKCIIPKAYLSKLKVRNYFINTIYSQDRVKSILRVLR